MKSQSAAVIKPRKMPVQARAAQTVAAISEATIQVLFQVGLERLTTTRVAERAGVSVGTLYQYYPNKAALLYALLEQKLQLVTAALERACSEAHDLPLREMIPYVIERFVDAKMARADISAALYRISTEMNGPALVKSMEERSLNALEAMLKTAPDFISKPERFAIRMLYSALAGATRSVLEAGAPLDLVQHLRVHLVIFCRAYLTELGTQMP